MSAPFACSVLLSDNRIGAVLTCSHWMLWRRRRRQQHLILSTFSRYGVFFVALPLAGEARQGHHSKQQDALFAGQIELLKANCLGVNEE